MINDSGAAPIKVGLLNDLAEAPSTDLAAGGGVSARSASRSTRSATRSPRSRRRVRPRVGSRPAAARRPPSSAPTPSSSSRTCSSSSDLRSATTRSSRRRWPSATCVPTIHWAGTGGRAANRCSTCRSARTRTRRPCSCVTWSPPARAASASCTTAHRSASATPPTSRPSAKSRAGDRRATLAVAPLADDADVGAIMVTAADALVYLGLGLFGRAVARAANTPRLGRVRLHELGGPVGGHVAEVGAASTAGRTSTCTPTPTRRWPRYANGSAPITYPSTLVLRPRTATTSGDSSPKGSPPRRPHPGRRPRRPRTDQVGPRGRGSRGHDTLVRHPGPRRPPRPVPRAPPLGPGPIRRGQLTRPNPVCVLPADGVRNWWISGQIDFGVHVHARPVPQEEPMAIDGIDLNDPERFVHGEHHEMFTRLPRRRPGVLAGGPVRWLLERRQAPGPHRRQPRHCAVLVGARRHADPGHDRGLRELHGRAWAHHAGDGPTEAHALPAPREQGLHAADDRPHRAGPRVPRAVDRRRGDREGRVRLRGGHRRGAAAAGHLPRSWACPRGPAPALRLVEPDDRRRRPRVRLGRPGQHVHRSWSPTATRSPRAAHDPRDDIVTTLLNAEIEGEQAHRARVRHVHHPARRRRQRDHTQHHHAHDAQRS